MTTVPYNQNPVISSDAGFPRSLDEIRDTVKVIVNSNSVGNREMLVKNYFNSLYQNGLPLEWRQFYNLCEDLMTTQQPLMTTKKEKSSTYWWEDL